MAYKFQLGDATLSGSLTQEGDIIAKSGGDASKGVVSASLGIRMPAAGTITARGGDLALDVTDLLKLDAITNGTVAANKAVVVDGDKDADGFRNIDGTGDLTMATISMSGFTVDADGDTALKSLAVDDSSTIGCDSDTDLLTFANQSITMAADAALTYKGTAITSTGAELNLVDGSQAGTVVNGKAVIYDAGGLVAGTDFKGPDGFDLGNASVADFMKFNAAEIIVKDGALDFDIASHDSSNGLKLGGSLVTSTAAELNLLDGSQASTVVNNKAVIYGASGQVQAGSVVIADDSTIGAVGDTNMITLDAGSDVTFASDLDVVMAEGKLVLGSTAVTSTAAELNLVDGAGAGSIVANKAVIYNGSGVVLGQSFGMADGGHLGPQSKPQLLQLTADGDAIFQDGTHDFDIASHDGSNGLKLGGNLVTSTAAEMNKLTGFADGTYNQAADSIVFLDADGSVMKSETNDAFLGAIAGPGLAVNSNKLTVQGSSVSLLATHGGAVVSEGYNYLANAVSASVICSLPSGSSAQIGDVYTIKAQAGVTDSRFIELRRQGTDLIDGETAARIESPFGAISVVYVAAGDFRII